MISCRSPKSTFFQHPANLRKENVDKGTVHVWRSIRFRVAACATLSLGFIPFALATQAYPRSNSNALIDAWMVCWAASTIFLFTSKCPNCRQSFFVKRERGNPFHCAVAVYAPMSELSCSHRLGPSSE